MRSTLSLLKQQPCPPFSYDLSGVSEAGILVPELGGLGSPLPQKRVRILKKTKPMSLQIILWTLFSIGPRTPSKKSITIVGKLQTIRSHS